MRKHERIAAQTGGLAARGGYHPCYLEYFRLFNVQEYYAAHDVLEHIWLGSDGERYLFYKALIQFAGGYVHLQHHHREPAHRIHGRRLRPAARLFRRSAELLGELPVDYEGVPIAEVVTMALATAGELESAGFATNPWHPERAPVLRGPLASSEIIL
jgi:predicted metal-dependent hydrolase